MPTRSIAAETSVNLACARGDGAGAPSLACNASMSGRPGQGSRHGRCSRFGREYIKPTEPTCWSEVIPMQRIVIFLFGLLLGGGLIALIPPGKTHDELTGALASPENHPLLLHMTHGGFLARCDGARICPRHVEDRPPRGRVSQSRRGPAHAPHRRAGEEGLDAAGPARNHRRLDPRRRYRADLPAVSL